MKNKKISIIVPVYNVEEYLSKCLDSLISQRYRNFEIVLIDDGSTDHSVDIINEYAIRYPFIRAFHHSNHGVSYTRNRGIKEAEGDYIAFIDGDDWADKDYLYKMINCLEASDLDFVVCNYSFYDNNTHETKEWIMYHDTKYVGRIQAAEMLLTTSCVPWNKVYKKSSLQDVTFQEDIAIGEDTVFLMQLLGKCKKIGFLKDSLLFYRQRDGSAMHSGLQQKIWDNIKSANIVYDMALAYEYSLIDAAEYRFVKNIMNVLWQLIYRVDMDIIKRKYSDEILNMKKSIRKRYRFGSCNAYIKSKERLYLNIAYLSPNLLLDVFQVRNLIRHT